MEVAFGHLHNKGGAGAFGARPTLVMDSIMLDDVSVYVNVCVCSCMYACLCVFYAN